MMDVSIKSVHLNDCAIVACSHYFGIPYDKVLDEFRLISSAHGQTYKISNGTPRYVTNVFLVSKGLKKRSKIPRRGQNKISGIVVMVNVNKTKAHMVAMIDGMVFDTVSPEGTPIDVYQRRVMTKHINEVWE